MSLPLRDNADWLILALAAYRFPDLSSCSTTVLDVLLSVNVNDPGTIKSPLNLLGILITDPVL